MSIREALNRLLGEGLLMVGEKGGYFVKPMTVDDVRLIREIREILELGALRLAYEKIMPEEIKQLKKICDDFSMMASQGYMSGTCEADIKFHETLIKYAHNEKLFHTYISGHTPLFHEKIDNALSTLNDYEQTDKEHRLIVKVLKARDLTLAEETLSARFEKGSTAVIDI
ncbi:MAG: GntR family transcriptional regulator [Sphingobacteriaceae bacterium]